MRPQLRIRTLILRLNQDGVRTLTAMDNHDLETTGIDEMIGTREAGTNTTDGATTTANEGAAREMIQRLHAPLPTHDNILPNLSKMPRSTSSYLHKLKVPQ